MADRSPRSTVLIRLVGTLLLISTGLSGCTSSTGTPPPSVSEGRFVARVDGAVVDTLTGDATLRLSDAGTLTGVELAVDEQRGVSVDLEPFPPALRAYTAIDPELLHLDRPGDTPGLVAYLGTPDGAFRTTHGRLDVSYVAEDAVGGSFVWEMEGTRTDSLGGPSTLTVEGALHAIAP